MSIMFVTMCNPFDAVWLDKWIRHNEPMVRSRSDLLILIDGINDEMRCLTTGCSVVDLDIKKRERKSFDGRRMRLILSLVRGFLECHKVVIYTDVDEFLCIDPGVGESLDAYLLKLETAHKVISAVGIELMYTTGAEEPLDLKRSILQQRPYGFLSEAYCKPCMFYQPVKRGHMHKIPGEPWVIDRNIYLFHGKFADKKMYESRVIDRAKTKKQFNMNGTSMWSQDGAHMLFEENRFRFLSSDPMPLKRQYLEAILQEFEEERKNSGKVSFRTIGHFEATEAMRRML